MTSAWDGWSRAPLRAGLAIVAGLDLIGLAERLRALPPGGARHPLAPAWLLALGAQPLAVDGLVAAGLVALLLFAIGRAPLRAGGGALVLLAVLAETQAALAGGPQRNVFASGATLLGWLIGLGWGRGLGGAGANREDLAEAGAVATFAATYVAAGVSKLQARGLGWADPLTLQDLLLAQHRVSEHGIRAHLVAAFVGSPGLCRVLALATLAIELGACLMLLTPALRLALGTLLVAFHLQVWLLTGIWYAGNLRLLLLLCVPWPWPRMIRRLLARWPVPPGPPPRDPAVERRVAIAALSILAAAIGLAALSPVRDYTFWPGRAL